MGSRCLGVLGFLVVLWTFGVLDFRSLLFLLFGDVVPDSFFLWKWSTV